MRKGSRTCLLAGPALIVALALSAATANAQLSGGSGSAAKPGAIENQLSKPDFNKGSAMELPTRSGTPPPVKKTEPTVNGKPVTGDVLMTVPGKDSGQKK